MNDETLIKLLLNLVKLLLNLVSFPKETEWIEFKHNFHSPDEIGERISALANSAALIGKPYGYLGLAWRMILTPS